ncbi:hypothetical protein AX769_09955 [Frondihabitans sp. PAMC 28766]|uniref:sensor histidine kinase n=1 Tax=Frondihabitans sp. PAMC 28766 TaxID=1795630 RepID=UPI00078B5958|nr:histidine kinase [Frondihabitans sp. PAMC 28766]AMM20414.1 hypothetical protein AX769_09955 [Frondihabitans sp. PAMC 28766]
MQASRPSLPLRLLLAPPPWAQRLHRALLLALPVLVTTYGIWYDALAAREAPDSLQVLVFVGAGATLWIGRRWPFVTVAAALACWSLTESCVFVIAAAYLLGRWQPRGSWLLLGLLATVHPLGLVPDPCAYRAGHTALPPETTPVFAVALPALVGAVILTTTRLAGLREDHVRSEALAAEERALARVTEDRLRLSEEMHDLLGQRVSRMVLHATAISATTGDERARELAGRIADTGASTVDDLQYIVGHLRATPAATALSHPSGRRAHESIAEARRDGTCVTTSGLDRVEALKGPLRDLCDAVVGEALHNAAKYACGAAVTVHAEVWSDRVFLRVENDECGAPASAAIVAGGHGLDLLCERARGLAGTVTHGFTPDGGYAVSLEVAR